jgi:hypothetical protein
MFDLFLSVYLSGVVFTIFLAIFEEFRSRAFSKLCSEYSVATIFILLMIDSLFWPSSILIGLLYGGNDANDH